ncbi:HIT domain-containing protein [Streptomonospora sp. S1-112]|uniref:HIT domain-containing protein n=1 Tax=Streptomonospora mangrovi TaxID=2883123 RepID=A0A9X3SFH8_9ACTN|nr:HIT domain-containing protein [Streptomonospora mangrovi]MDA0562979.1 HIT domain-containing protein [Streptomonospora mangrovi]
MIVSECPFCAIARGDGEASVVYADDAVMAFMDTAPAVPGQVLVVPREHVSGLELLDEELGARMWAAAHRIARALRRSELRCEGVNLFLADGRAAFQEVFHVHLHVLPRFAEDGFRLDARRGNPARAELETDAAAVRAGLAALAAEKG